MIQVYRLGPGELSMKELLNLSATDFNTKDREKSDTRCSTSTVYLLFITS